MGQYRKNLVNRSHHHALMVAWKFRCCRYERTPRTDMLRRKYILPELIVAALSRDKNLDQSILKVKQTLYCQESRVFPAQL